VLKARDAGVVVPPRYRSEWQAGEGDRNADAIAVFSKELAKRIDQVQNLDLFPLVLGGDCSILIGNGLALKKKGRFGLVYCDAHSDFRHEGNAEAIGAAGGESLAIVTGRGDARLINIEGKKPYFRDEDIALLGIRTTDDYLKELDESGILTLTSNEMREAGMSASAARAMEKVSEHTEGFWIHIDLDILDSTVMQAVDCPEPDGLFYPELVDLIQPLLNSPQCAGVELTIFDPDLDPNGDHANEIVRFLDLAFQGNRFGR
jgi:arginase